MFGLGMGEMVVIVVIAIVLFGTTDLPKNLRKAAKGLNEFKKVANDAQRQWNEVRDDVARTIMSADLEEKAKEKAARVAELHAGETPAEHGVDMTGGATVGGLDTSAHSHSDSPGETVTETSVYTASGSIVAEPGTPEPSRLETAAASITPAASASAAPDVAAPLPVIRPAEGAVVRSSHEAPVDHSDPHHEERGKEPLETPAPAGGVQKSS